MRVVVAIAVDGRGPLICLGLDLAKSTAERCRFSLASNWPGTGEEAGGDRFPALPLFNGVHVRSRH